MPPAPADSARAFPKRCQTAQDVVLLEIVLKQHVLIAARQGLVTLLEFV